MVCTHASIRWHQYWPKLQPPVVLQSGTAEQQVNGLRRELQPEEQRDYHQQHRTNVSSQKHLVVTILLHLEVLGGGWGCSKVGGSGHGPERRLDWAEPPAALMPTDLHD